VRASPFANTADPSALYIFPPPVPGPLASDQIPGASRVPQSFSHPLMAQDPIRTKSGTVRIADSKNFPASVTIAAALVEILPGGMRELHWHPNTDEWQYYIEGQGRMGVFASAGDARRRRRLRSVRHGPLHREYCHPAAAVSQNVQEQLLRRCLAHPRDGAAPA